MIKGSGSPKTTESCCPQPLSLQHSPVHSPHGMGGLVCPRHAPRSSLLFLLLRLNTPGSSLPHQIGRSHSSFPPAPCPPWGRAQVSRTLRTVGFLPTSTFDVTRGAPHPVGPESHRPRSFWRGRTPPQDAAQGGLPSLGEDFLSGPRGSDGKGPCCGQVWPLSPPTGQGFRDKGRQSDPRGPLVTARSGLCEASHPRSFPV